MRQFIIFFLGAFFSQNIFSQKIDSVIVVDGINMSCSHELLDGETVTFHLKDDTNDNIKWTLNIFDKRGNDLQVLESGAGLRSFTFNITPELIPIESYECKTIEFYGDHSVYIYASIHLYKQDILIDSLPILLNVLPSRPMIKDVFFSGGSFDYNSLSYNSLATLKVMFLSDRIETCYLKYHATSQDPCDSQFPKDYTLGINIVDFNKVVGGVNNFEYHHADWGEFYTICSSNKYGAVNGVDTIFTTSLITDSDVLEFLSNLCSTGISDLNADIPRVEFTHNTLIIEGNIDPDIYTEVYSTGGSLVYRTDSQRRIDLNFLNRGVYIVRIKLNKGKTIVKKIIKS